MKTKILLAAVAGALVLPVPMASQADVMSGMDFKISGRISAGITRQDTDTEGRKATWDLGTTIDGTTRTDSRITLTADRDTDFGTAGFKLERDWTTSGLTDNRHQYIYLGGDFGTLYVGNHGNPVGMGNGYDQSYFFGGGGRINDGDRLDGVGYTYSSGALSFGITLHGDDNAVAFATCDTDSNTGGVQAPETDAELQTSCPGEYRKANETIDTTVLGVSYDFGVAKVGASYWKDNTENGHDSTSIMVNGDFGQLSYWVMYEAASDARPNIAGNMKNDVNGLGVHLGWALSDADNVWLQYGSRDYDLASASDRTDVVVGYSHSFGGGATAVIEYRSRDQDDVGGTANPDPSILHISARVSF